MAAASASMTPAAMAAAAAASVTPPGSAVGPPNLSLMAGQLPGASGISITPLPPPPPTQQQKQQQQQQSAVPQTMAGLLRNSLSKDCSLAPYTQQQMRTQQPSPHSSTGHQQQHQLQQQQQQQHHQQQHQQQQHNPANVAGGIGVSVKKERSSPSPSSWHTPHAPDIKHNIPMVAIPPQAIDNSFKIVLGHNKTSNSSNSNSASNNGNTGVVQAATVTPATNNISNAGGGVSSSSAAAGLPQLTKFFRQIRPKSAENKDASVVSKLS